MSFGMEIYSASGVLQADANLLSYFCRKSSTVTSVTRIGGNTSPSSIIIPISGQGYTYPIVAFLSNNNYIARTGISIDGDYVYACSGSIGTTVDYFIFDYSPVLPASTIGIELYNASGQRTFSSNFFPMQALNIITSGSVTHSGKTLAVGLPGLGGHRIAGPIEYYDNGNLVVPGSPYTDTGYQNNAKRYGGRVNNSNQTIEYGEVSYDDVYVGPVPGDVYVPPDWTYYSPIMAIDVTNIPLNTTFF